MHEHTTTADLFTTAVVPARDVPALRPVPPLQSPAAGHQLAAAEPAPAPVVVVDAHEYAALAQRAETGISRRAKDIAVVSAGVGMGLGTAGTGIGVGAGMIATAAPGLMAAAAAIAIGAGSISALVLVLKNAVAPARSTPAAAGAGAPDHNSGPGARTHITHVTTNVTATGIFGRAQASTHLPPQ